MTESQSDIQSTSQLSAAPAGVYNFNLSLSGQFNLQAQETDTIQETEDEVIQTAGVGGSDSVIQSTSQLRAAPAGVYNFNLNLSGQFNLQAQETDTIQETEDEVIQTQ
jgi:hypothetical protein